jgi:glycosyltransferase involved in cell wall biosynthesis
MISKKAFVIRSGIEINKYKFNNKYRNKLQKELGLQNKFIVGNIARFTFEKNHEFMINIIESLSKIDKDIVLCLVGDGILKEKIKNMVTSKNLGDNVCFVDNASNAYKYYSFFDVFILPSIYEGLPVTSIEAQIASLPTIISDSVTDECKISNKTYFTSINSISNWVDQILEIKEDMQNNTNYRKEITIDDKKYDRNYTFKELEKIYKI